MEIKDFADAMAKIAALNDERVKAFDDFRSGCDLLNKTSCLINMRDQYVGIANWLLCDELRKGYYTLEDQQLGKLCIEGIAACNNELGQTCFNYMADKVQSELLSFLFGSN